MENRNNTTKALLAIVGLVVIVAVGIIAFQALNADNTTPNNNTQITNEQGGNSESMTEASSYNDGTYQAVGSYITPGGAQEVGVKVTLSNGVIEEVEVDRLGTFEISIEKQADFAEHYKPFVIGKNINEVKLSKVSGSSLTPIGFNDALDQIKDQARS